MVSERLHQALSALADGRATAQDWAEIEAAWPHNPELQARWAEIAWISDGLRSSDLLTQRGNETALIAALPSTPVAPRRRDWWTPAAVAAGFALVALLVPQLRTTDSTPEVTAQAAPATTLSGPSFAQAAAGRSPGAWPHLPTGEGVREAGLDVAPPMEFIFPAAPVRPLPPASQPLRRP